MLTGLNHLTLAVSDLNRSLAFYRDPLRSSQPCADYTHYAFSLDAADFSTFVHKLQAANVQEWRDNRSEGASFYFLDPDGHKLEAHVGDLASRLSACRQKPYAGMRFYDES
ncbi:glutathione transferase [Pseudomonas sp. Irchel s3a12]|uniref:glutathione transferase n=1 Tax=Pseudomonas sp. Irchel s3a12 TaxID=2009047 RepID=UPI000BA32BAD|nr:glutathione transferase [Pseudomonas sp. Irchel s3a12]